MDPVSITDEQFNSECLPPIEATDLLSYLVLETSFYTKQQFKTYKSLEAYNFMVSGFIMSIQGCIVSESTLSQEKWDIHSVKWGWQAYTTPQRLFKIVFL